MRRQTPDAAIMCVDGSYGGVEYLRAAFNTHAFSMHAHDEYVIALVQRGTEVFKCRGAQHIAPQGSVYAINPGEAHDGRAATQEGWNYFAFYPSAAFMERAVGGAPPFSKIVRQDPRLALLLSALHALLGQQGCDLEKESAFTRVIRLIASSDGPGCAPPRAASASQLNRVRELLCDQSTEPHTLERLGAEADMHPNYLLAAFRSAFGATPAEFLRARRLVHAKRLIRSGMTLTTAALEAGFCDQAHLTRSFKKALGITPAAYAAAIH